MHTVRNRIARISLALGVLVLVFAGMILCACPSLYILAMGFMAVGVCGGTGRTRKWAIGCLAAAVIISAMAAFA